MRGTEGETERSRYRYLLLPKYLWEEEQHSSISRVGRHSEGLEQSVGKARLCRRVSLIHIHHLPLMHALTLRLQPPLTLTNPTIRNGRRNQKGVVSPMQHPAAKVVLRERRRTHYPINTLKLNSKESTRLYLNL